jgi:hypothetical protein
VKRGIAAIGVFLVVIGSLQIGLSSIVIPRTARFSIPVHKDTIPLCESFVLPPSTIATRTVYFAAGDVVEILTSVASGENETIDFSVNDGSITYLSYSKTNQVREEEWIVPASSNYTFVYDNSFSATTPKNITTELLKYWNETKQIDVPWNFPLLSSTYFYVGAALVLAGAGLTVYVVVRKEASKPPTP